MSAELLVRCSSIGKLMAKPDNADLFPDLITPELGAIINKTKRSEEERALLEAARRKSLSAGARTHVRGLVREAVFSYEPAELHTRPILKGKQVEPDCIAVVARQTGRPLVKNTERRDNGLITGECDIFDAPLRHGRDIKAPYSMENMPIVLADAYDSDYWWQMQGYMILWDAESWSVDYVLVNTPEDLIGPVEPAALHYVDHIPEHLRWTTWLVKRDRSVEQVIVDKVTAARRYYREVLAEFDATHRGGEPPTWVTAPDAAPTAPAPKATTTKPEPVEALAPTF